MKIKFVAGRASAAALTLALALGAAACGGKDDNANNTNGARNANANANANTAATSTPTPTPVSTSEDTAVKNKTEAALAKAGVTGVTVEVKGGEVTLKGEVAKAKWQDAMKAANESGAKKVNNQLNDKK